MTFGSVPVPGARDAGRMTPERMARYSATARRIAAVAATQPGRLQAARAAGGASDRGEGACEARDVSARRSVTGGGLSRRIEEIMSTALEPWNGRWPINIW